MLFLVCSNENSLILFVIVVAFLCVRNHIPVFILYLFFSHTYLYFYVYIYTKWMLKLPWFIRCVLLSICLYLFCLARCCCFKYCCVFFFIFFSYVIFFFVILRLFFNKRHQLIITLMVNI